MAHLFSHKLLHDTVKWLAIPQMDEKIAVLQSWVNAINNKSIYKKTESECEQAFNLDIFHKVLGYAFYPTENYTLEAKGWNEVSGQKADATLGYFNVSDIAKNVSLVQVAVEIKDANTPLTKSQRREWNLSPIQQWFKYKPQYNNCKRVLVTNFVEVRLFKDTQLDYEVWSLVDLVNPENDYHNFKVFWYLLNTKHLIAPVGLESVTEKLLSVVRIQSEQITKKFYQEYKTLRLELINDIRAHNPEVSLDIVLQKSQKVIDRIVFVHFCEDFGLLPEGKLAEVIQYSQSLVGVSVWQILSGFFEAVNSGSSKLGIPNGYNGWLFHEDKELNSLKIWDDICQKFVDLWKYDFQEELSVNILWHIFEQSISDLEDLRINMLGTELETWELGESSKSNKRKKDGIFYTPEYIVDYIVRNSLGKYLEEQFEAIEHKHLKKEKQMSDKVYQEKQLLIYGEYKQVLENITVLDPACGSGAFLVKVFDYLLAEHKRVGEALGMGSLFDNESTYKSILQRNIYGVDLNAESVEITKLSLWLKTAEKGKKLADLDGNIKCGNSLIDDPAVAGDKAFDWKTEFADIMNAWGFDVIVGNPPYVRNELMSEIEKKYYDNKYSVFTWKTDLYVLFVEQGRNLLVKNWYQWFIIPNKFTKTKYWINLIDYITKNVSIKQYIDFNDANIFEGIIAYPSIIIFQNKVQNINGYSYYSVFKWDLNLIIADQINLNKAKQNELFAKASYDWWADEYLYEIFKKIKWNWKFLNDLWLKPQVWIKTWYNKAYIYNWNKWFQLEYDYLIGRDVKKYQISKSNTKVLAPYELQDNTLQLISLDKFSEEKLFLEQNKHLLEKRAIIKDWISKGKNTWYEFQQIKNNFDYRNYIVFPDISSDVNFSLVESDKPVLFDMTCFWIQSNNLTLLAILNSKLISLYLNKTVVKARWWYLRLKSQYISNIPLPKTLKSDKIEQNVTLILSLNKQLQEKLDFTLRFLQSKFSIEKPSTKLSKFRELDFAGFLKELKVKKLPLDTEAELMRYFEKEKTEIVTLKAQIDTLDKQIDDMVFDLYGLTEEERKVVLDS